MRVSHLRSDWQKNRSFGQSRELIHDRQCQPAAEMRRSCELRQVVVMVRVVRSIVNTGEQNLEPIQTSATRTGDKSWRKEHGRRDIEITIGRYLDHEIVSLGRVAIDRAEIPRRGTETTTAGMNAPFRPDGCC